jgi:hypothetical protein
MAVRPIESQPRQNSDRVASSLTGRAEVIDAIALLAKEMARLALHVKSIIAFADGQPKRYAVQQCAQLKTAEQAELSATATATDPGFSFGGIIQPAVLLPL